jgi:hypothetical protein
MTGIAVELGVVLAVQTLGTGVFGRFEGETPAWQKILKWTTLILVTVGLSTVVGHWALLFPAAMLTVGAIVHIGCAESTVSIRFEQRRVAGTTSCVGGNGPHDPCPGRASRSARPS